MDNILYTSMLSANQLLEKQAVISNNLANISTMGFKEKFNYILHDQNHKNNKVKEYYNFSPGSLIYTQNKLDVFVKNNGWLAIRDENNNEAYTKNGHLQVNRNGKLTINNLLVIDKNNHSIKIPNYTSIEILSNGVITAKRKNALDSIKQKIGTLKLVYLPNYKTIKKENGYFYLRDEFIPHEHLKTISHDKNIRIQSGILEDSNVNPTKNMISMISNARQFDTQMQIISAYNKNMEYANQILNINN